MANSGAATVSVIIPHYGEPAPTVALIDMLRSQHHADLQIIVSDDASPTPFPDIAGIDVVRREVNGGFGSAVNSGAALAQHPLLLILNSDLTVDADFVTDLVTAAHPWQPCVAGPLTRNPSGKVDPTARHFPTTGHQVIEWLTPLTRFRHHRALREAVGHDLSATPGTIRVVDWIVGAALLIPTSAFREVGGFDERFFMNSEEVDLQRRLGARGIPSLFVGTVSAVHEGGGSSDPQIRRQWLVQARFRYAAKWGGERRLRMALRGATAVNLAANVVRRLAGNSAVDPLADARYEWHLTRRRDR